MKPSIQTIKEVQRQIGTTIDGVVGPKTIQKLKLWQAKNGLDVSGVIDDKTISFMGILSTDLSESKSNSIDGHIVNKYYLPKSEYMIGSTPRYIFLHHTAGWHNPYRVVDDWASDSRGDVATKYVIGGQSIKNSNNSYDGELVECLPDGAWGWHLGIGRTTMHKHSIGIELNNFGWVDSNNKVWTGASIDTSQIVTLSEPFRGYKKWHRYSDKQLDVLKSLILKIANVYSIDVKAGLVDFIKTESPIKAFEYKQSARLGNIQGILSHSNVRLDKFDVSPQPNLIDMLRSL